ncbi:MAG: hypothetical protein NVS2B5_21600 [Beijerinckiaceae bacterium]
MSQMPLAEYDHMIKTLASNRADQSFRVSVLPRRSWRCRSIANADRSNASGKGFAIDAVAITNEMEVPAAGFGDLPRDPLGRRMRSNAKPEDTSAVMS